jgi:IS30 family transposase
MGKQYKHFSSTERIQLSTLETEGCSVTEIAKRLGKDRSSIYREQSRNMSSTGYSPDKATALALKRKTKQSILEMNLSLQSDVISLLKRHYSPRQIAVTLKNSPAGSVSHETIYQFVYSDIGKHLDLPKWLARKHRKRKPRVKNKIKKSPIPNRNPIKNRPIAIESREEFGHWEGDLMIFSKTNTNLITLRERTSRLILAIKNPSKHAEVTAKNIISTFRGTLQELIATLTLDNGGEFAQHELIAEKLQLKTFFCDPYASWQKGTNEQGNGIVRVEMPRDIDIDGMSQYCINNMMRNINNRPMQLHDDLSPAQIFKKMAGNNLKGVVALQT